MEEGPRGIHRRIEFDVTESLRVRFNRKVDRRADSECWPWMGALRNGYGAIKHAGKVLGTHVVAFRIAHGDIPAGMLVKHSCDNRLCVNPHHLSAGTPTENVLEMFDRRRVNVCRGEAAPNATLSDDQVRLILSLHKVFGIGARRQSRLVDIPEHAISHVISRIRWAHITVTDDEANRIAKDFARINFPQTA